MIKTRFFDKACLLSFVALICGSSFSSANADVTIDATSIAQSPEGVQIGDAQRVQSADGHAEIRLSHKGISVSLADSLSAESGTIRISFRLSSNWPSEARQTLFHVGDRSHTHVTLFAEKGRLTAVYKSDRDHHASIQYRESESWIALTNHEAIFGWHTKDDTIRFYLELDGKLVGQETGKLIEDWPNVGYLGARRSQQIWLGTLHSATLSSLYSTPAELLPGRRTVVVDGDRAVGECYNFWSINNFTSQHMFADPHYAQRVKQEKPFMKEVNCVRLLGGRVDGRNKWFQGVTEQHTRQKIVSSNFTDMTVYLKGILDAGYTPRIVLDNIPFAMSESGENAKYGNTRPATDLDVWHQYVQQAVTAMTNSFGIETVAKWRFRVGTEPDLYPGHWQGTKQEYLRHYDCTVDAVCSVIPNAQIGPGNVLNPSDSNKVNLHGQTKWGLDIVDHCGAGTNTWTGMTSTATEPCTRISFLQCSWYGRVGGSIDSINIAIQRMKDRLDRYPSLQGTPISIAEFGVLADEYGNRLYGGEGTEWSASWYAAIADRIYDLNVEQVHEWSQTTSGILRPRANVIGMLQQMHNGQRLPVAVEGESAAQAGALACLKNDTFFILLYNHRPQRDANIPEQIDLTLKSQQLDNDDQWTISEWAIDKEHGVFMHKLYEDCQRAGLEPLPKSPIFGGQPSRRFGPAVFKLLAENRKLYNQLAQPSRLQDEQSLTIVDGMATMNISMPGHSVRFLKIARRH
ncbi:Beta-xylosidase [Planctomycetes bacterium CA13]|uniref:Beta-xylosidase n=1 Tax=Novipirellula herctigrandis TaxID=2527986 RepID=A0A5C5YXM2_9BACT|nr:Beta-xylosidase [Planctomycetes bacterium CA13]